MPLYVGTSGWQYPHWRGRFYPEGVPQRRWLAFYAARFPAVEVNNAFYRLPDRAIFESWRDRTPAGFVVAVKASRYLTHVRRLVEPTEPVRRLMDRAAGLGDRLGPVLLQLPPTMRADPDRLTRCLRSFPSRSRVAVEPRHESWWCTPVRRVLERFGAALCWADRLGRPVTPLWRTTDWGYLRLHEGRARPWPHYGYRSLHSWWERLADSWSDRDEVYVFFNNDPDAAAVDNAGTLIRLAGRAEQGGALRPVERTSPPEPSEPGDHGAGVWSQAGGPEPTSSAAAP